MWNRGTTHSLGITLSVVESWCVVFVSTIPSTDRHQPHNLAVSMPHGHHYETRTDLCPPWEHIQLQCGTTCHLSFKTRWIPGCLFGHLVPQVQMIVLTYQSKVKDSSQFGGHHQVFDRCCSLGSMFIYPFADSWEAFRICIDPQVLPFNSKNILNRTKYFDNYFQKVTFWIAIPQNSFQKVHVGEDVI